MNYLNQKQKIIVIIVIIIGIALIGYYVYGQENRTEENNELEENLNVEQNEIKEEKIPETIKVHITGAVQKEGIIELETNSRIADAVEKAGGLKEEADLTKINLAYLLEDGVKIHIPYQNEKESTEEIQTEIPQESNTQNKKQEQTKKVNINTANQTELETLPGIGPSTALKIIQYRTEKGKFKTIEGVKEVSGIGDSKYNKIKDFISIK